jgi:hypothetical protein
VLAGLALAAASVLPVAAATSGSPLGLHALTRDTIPATWLTHPAGAPPASSAWHVGVSVRGRDAAGLQQLMRDQYVKGSKDYRHFLTPAEYASRFGADPAQAKAVAQWLTAKGLHLSYSNAEGTYLLAEGTVAQVESTFATHLATFTGKAGTPFARFTANTSAPTVPSAVTAVAGLDTLSTAHRSVMKTDFPIPSSTSPKDLWSTYEQPSNNTGQGQKLAAFGWGSPGTVEPDLRKFEQENALPQIPFTITQVGTPNTTDTSGVIEWDLDSQAATGMAPDAAGMTFYFANSGNSDLLAAAIDTWASDPAGATQASGSYGLCDAFGFLGTFDAHEAALTKAAAEGRSFFASTGDNGSGCSAAGAGVNGVTIGPIPSAEYPSTSPNAIGVGGTVLYTTGDPATRDQEIAWTHTGGGSSTYFAAADYQSGLDPQFTVVGRPTADVAAQSGDLLSGYNIVSGGSDTTVGGTSLSAPLWQGMWARVSAAAPAAADGSHPGAGFANRLIYPIGADPTKYAASFADIIVGANGLYTALPGYDYLTGFGVPRVTGLVTTIDGTTTPVVGSTGGTGGGTGGSTGGTTGTPLPACGTPAIADASGDATQFVLVDSGQPAANQPDLDITSADLSWNESAQTLTASIHVADLAATPDASENFRYDLTYDTVGYELSAQRDETGAESFSWSKPGLNAASLGSLNGSFDDATSTITIALPAATYAAAQPSQHPLGDGSVISGLSLLSQRLLGVITATADDAAPAADCSYTVPTPAPTATGGTTGGPGNAGPCPAASQNGKGSSAGNGRRCGQRA